MKINQNNEKFNKIILLEYFDVYTQISYYAQIIVYESTNKPTYNTLLQYIY